MSRFIVAASVFLVLMAVAVSFFIGHTIGYHNGWKDGFHDYEKLVIEWRNSLR